MSKRIWVIIATFTAVFFAVWLALLPEAKADDYATAAIGVFNSGTKNDQVSVKFINIGHRSELALGLTQQFEVGGWSDIARRGRKSSAYGAYQVGVETDGPVFARVMFGPALITNPDSYLGGPFQFTEDFVCGLRGKNGNTVGAIFKHLSSAGLELPNRGRDQAGVTVSIPF